MTPGAARQLAASTCVVGPRDIPANVDFREGIVLGAHQPAEVDDGSRDGAVARRRWYRGRPWVGFAVVSVMLLLIAAARYRPYYVVGDNSVMRLELSAGLWKLPSTGVYSRFGFRHPGPALYWWLYPFVRVFGDRGMMWAAIVFNGGVLTAIYWQLWRLGRWTLLVPGGAIVCAVVAYSAQSFLSPWNVWMAQLPVLLALTLVWSASDGFAPALPGLCATVSWMIQLHAGLVQIGIALALVGSIVWLRAVPRDRRADAVLAAGCIAFVMWAPPVLEQIAGHGNLGQIFDAMKNPPANRAGWSIGLRGVEQAVKFPPAWIHAQPDVNALGNPLAVPWWQVVPFLLAVGSVLLFARQQQRRLLFPQAIVLMGCVVAWIACAGVFGPLYHYLIRWVWWLGVLQWILFGSVFVQLVQRAWRKRRDQRAREPVVPRRVAVGAVGAVGAVVATLWTGLGLVTYSRPIPEAVSLRLLDVAAPAALTATRPGEHVLILVAGDIYSAGGTGLLSYLRAHGRDAATPKALGNSHSEPWVEEPSTIYKKTITVEVSTSLRPPATVEASLLALWDPLPGHERDEFNKLAALEKAKALSPQDRRRLKELRSAGPGIAVYLNR